MENIINPNPAQQVVVNTETTFTDFANKVRKESKRPLRLGNGELIELAPDAVYTTLLLKVEYLLSKEAFEEFEKRFGLLIAQAVMDGVIEPDWFQGLATPLDLHTPAIPEQYQDDEHDIKIYLVGEVGFALAKTPIPEVEIDDAD